MNAIRFIARDDLRRVYGNVMVSIFLSVLVALPLLFTWFNVLASWDPLGNSGRLQIAVANTDEGYRTDVLNLKVNVGDRVLAQLGANKKMDWVITDEASAIEGTRSGEYYAAIVLPKDFSTSMFTFYAGGAAPSDITLYVNEKKNPLSENISNQGAEGVTAQINSAFTDVLSEVALGLAQELSATLDDSETAAALDRLQTRLESLSRQLRSGSQTVRSFQALVGASIPLVEGSQRLTASLSDSLAAPGDIPADPGTGLEQATASLGASLEQTEASINAVHTRLDSVLDSTAQSASAQAGILDTAADGVDRQIASFRQARDQLVDGIPSELQDTPAVSGFYSDIDQAIARQENLSQRLRFLAEELRADPGVTQQARDEARAAVNEAATAISDARDSYRTDVQPQLDQLRTSLAAADDSLSVVGSHLERISADLATDDGLAQMLTDTQTSLGASADRMLAGAERVDGARNQLVAARTTGDLQRIAAVIGADPSTFAKLLASPIGVERTAIFPVASFGVGMTPLYGTIALWIGALLSAVFLHTDVSRNVHLRYRADTAGDGAPHGGDPSVVAHAGATDHRSEPGGGFTGAQEYFGRFVLFWLVGMAQSTLLMLGLIVFVGIAPAHPWLLMVSAWAASTVFMMIIYTLVLSLSNAGKAIAVVLLVLQISAAGGAYPLELLPTWFQNISPWLPATYVINMMRAAIAGIYDGDFLVNLGMLVGFLIPTLLVGLVLRHPIANLIHNMTAALETTKLM